jgi:AraC-like DNA-binding protein
VAGNHLRYDYAGDRRLLEGADWFGRRPGGLQRHFHDEVQASVVLNGFRDYRIGTHSVRLRPGQMLVIAPLRSHHALPSLQTTVRSIEFYLAAAALSAAARQRLGSSDFTIIEEPEWSDAAPRDVVEGIARGLTESGQASTSRPVQSASPAQASLLEAALRYDSVNDAARQSGFTREGFIRAFFRHHGMTPHAYKMNRRLNRGRDLLRQGEGIADIAQATGFSDQSHFGRAFLNFFGATPGSFRAAHRIR